MDTPFPPHADTPASPATPKNEPDALASTGGQGDTAQAGQKALAGQAVAAPRVVVVSERRDGPLDERQDADSLAQAFAGSSGADRERLARIVNLLPCYVALIDDQYRVSFHNKAFEQFFGCPDGRPCHSLLRGLDSPCRFCPPLEVANSRNTSVMEWVNPRTKHAFRVYSYPFEEPGGERLVLKVGFNVTSSIRVQQALDLSEQSYRVITDNLSIGIALLDLELHIKAGNSRLAQWFGDGLVRGRQVCEALLCPGYEPEQVASGVFCQDCPFMAAVKDGASHEKEFAVTFQDGKERTVRLVACPVSPRKGAARALIMMLEDITNRLRVNQQLQRARKIEAMGTLAGGIAHEINQPLSALHLYASGLQMLLDKGDLSSGTTQERLTLIMHEAEKIRSIIAHMRSLVMQEGSVPMGPVSLSSVVTSALGIMRHQLTTRGIKVHVGVPSALPMVRSNAVQLEQVLVNLLGNAVHALDSDAARKEGAGPKPGPLISIRAVVREGGGRVRVEVADNGPGLAKGSERIFDPFFTTKERHQGMGLGLSIVHGLVSLWGGEVSAVPHHPQLGGAAFYVELDIAGEPEKETAENAPEADSEAGA